MIWILKHFLKTLISPVWLGIYAVIAFFIVDLYLFNDSFTVEEEETESTYLSLQAYTEFERQRYKDYLEEERKYNEMLERNKEYKALAREYECGKGEFFCKKDSEGNFIQYKDAVGIKTICYGNTSFPKKHPNVLQLSKKECEYLLDEDINKKLAQFYNDELYLLHKDAFDSHPRDKDKYLDVIFFAGFNALKYKKQKCGKCKKQLTDTYKAALKNPFSEEAENGLKTYNKVGGKENAGLNHRNNKNIEIARNERKEAFKTKEQQKDLTLAEYFNLYAEIR